MNERHHRRTSWLWGILLVSLLALLAGLGCDRTPDVPSSDQPSAEPPPVSPQVAALGLEEGDIHYKTAYRYKSLSVFDPPVVEKIAHIVEGGRLRPLDPAEPVDDAVFDQGVMYYDPVEAEAPAAAEAGEAEPWSDPTSPRQRTPQTGPRLPEFLASAPDAIRSTTSMSIARGQRIGSPELLLDLASSGIKLQYRQSPPSPTGATEVVELFLDGGTHAAIEQFEDPEELAIWYRANTKIMDDMGMDPEEHIVLRGMTLVRVGKGGHPLAMERARAIPMVDAKEGFMPPSEVAPSTCPR